MAHRGFLYEFIDLYELLPRLYSWIGKVKKEVSVRCPSCGIDNLQFMFTNYDETTNIIIRRYNCPNCQKEYTTNEMIVDDQNSVVNEIKFLKDMDRIHKSIILDSRNELRGLIDKLNKAKRMLDGIIIDDIDE